MAKMSNYGTCYVESPVGSDFTIFAICFKPRTTTELPLTKSPHQDLSSSYALYMISIAIKAMKIKTSAWIDKSLDTVNLHPTQQALSDAQLKKIEGMLIKGESIAS